MRKAVVVLLVLGALAFTPAPVSAAGGPPCFPVANGNGAATCTVTAKDVPSPIFVGPCLNAVGVSALLISANTIAHVTGLTTGPEFWATMTETGPVALSSPDGITGRATEWFGISFNNLNQVAHATSDGQLTLPGGTAIRYHEAFHFSTDAGGQGPVSFDSCTVS
ncbi:hypothetical protein EPN29_10585 [bacterium]|nr:MAG: hypothetical protein EPN29_10585 [bacterium]